MDIVYCKDLEENLKCISSLLGTMHQMVSLYVDKPVYGRLLGDLERKQADFLLILDSLKRETGKSLDFKNQIETWSNELLNSMWKEAGNSTKTKVKGIKALKNGTCQTDN